MEDTICAIATTVGNSSINIIRVSGSSSISIVNKIFDKDLTKKDSHTINYGHIIDNGEIIDEVLVSIFKAPKSFTTENVVEINLHGGVSCVNKTLLLLQEYGCRLAEPGEFTKRAFLHGRISLTEAEAISDLISSENETFRKVSMNSLNKGIYNIVKGLKDKVASLLGNIEVNIDYPEYDDIEVITRKRIDELLSNVYDTINKLVKDSETGQIIKSGINIALVGKPNVGKSSLLNRLLNEEKAIVTNIEGTTRDVVEGKININGISANLYDTAGIRETSNAIESIGIEKSLKTIKNSNLVLFILDSNRNIDKEDEKIFELVKDYNVLFVINKIDIGINNKDSIYAYINKKVKNPTIIEISAINDLNINILTDKIGEILNISNINSNNIYITNSRQIALLNKCKGICNNIKNAIKNEMPIDIIDIDITELWNTLGEINGDSYKEELLDEIFKRFCLGK